MMTRTAPNQHWYLNAVSGWGVATRAALRELTQSPQGVLSLDGLPGNATEVAPSAANVICCASDLACDECGNVLALDAACGRVAHVDLPDCVRIIDTFGGEGREPRQL